jgi:hypothetical protein
MIRCVARGKPEDRDLARFAPRVTLTLLAGFVVFLLTATLYVLPVLREPAPPGAIPDYHKERVMARLEGKVHYFLIGSFVGVTLLSIRGLLPGTSRRSRS